VMNPSKTQGFTVGAQRLLQGLDLCSNLEEFTKLKDFLRFKNETKTYSSPIDDDLYMTLPVFKELHEEAHLSQSMKDKIPRHSMLESPAVDLFSDDGPSPMVKYDMQGN